jgi:hypothetical protein
MKSQQAICWLFVVHSQSMIKQEVRNNCLVWI